MASPVPEAEPAGEQHPHRFSFRQPLSRRSAGPPTPGVVLPAAGSGPQGRVPPVGVPAAPRAGRARRDESGRRRRVARHRGGQLGGPPPGGAGWAAQPGEPERVPDAELAPPGRVPGRRRLVMHGRRGQVAEVVADAEKVGAEQFLLAAKPQPGREAARRPEGVGPQHGRAGHDAEQRGTRQPGRPGTGEPASSGMIGSSWPDGSTTIRAVTAATSGCASSASAARVSEPGSHQVSSSQNAT